MSGPCFELQGGPAERAQTLPGTRGAGLRSSGLYSPAPQAPRMRGKGGEGPGDGRDSRHEEGKGG